MPAIRDFSWVYETNTIDAGLTIPMCTAVSGDLLLVFCMADTGAGTWGAAGYTQLFARNNTTSMVCYYKIATGSDTDVVVTNTVNETYNGAVIAIRDVDVAYPFGNPAVYAEEAYAGGARTQMASITTTRDNSLLMYWMTSAVVSAPSMLEGPVYSLWAADGSAEAMGFGWGFQKTAGLSTSGVYGSAYGTGAGLKATIQVWPPSGGAQVIPTYVASDASRYICPLHGVTAWSGATALAATADTNFGTAMSGVTANDATVAAIADVGINSFHSMGGLTNAATTGQISGAEYIFPATGRPNIGAKNLLAHVRASTPANLQRFSNIKSQRGAWFGVRSNTAGTSDHRIWQIHGVDAPWGSGAHVPIIINTQSSGTIRQAAGTLTSGAIVAVGFWTGGIGALTAQMGFGSIWLLDETTICGGNAGEPISIQAAVDVLGKGKERVSALLQGDNQMLLLQKVQFGNGGTNPVYLDFDATAVEFPVQYSVAKKQINYHSVDNMVGIKYYAGVGDTIKHRNSSMSSASRYAWGFHASSAPSATATYDFAGLTVIGAGEVTLVSGITLSDMSFMGCATISPPAGISLTSCTFSSGSDAHALYIAGPDVMAGITDCAISDSVNGVQLPASGTYAFDGIVFGGNTYDVNVTATTGLITINVTGGGTTPTYQKTALSQVVINNAVTHTLTGLEMNTEITYVSGVTTLYNVEDASLSDGYGKYKTEYQYNYTADFVVDILIHHVNYKPDISSLYGVTLSSTNQTVPVKMFSDENYSNP